MNKRGFTLVELLVVITIIAVLTAILTPVLVRARIRGKVAHVHVELQGIQRALEMYRDDWGDYPPASVYCEEVQRDDYLELPPPLYKLHYIGAHRVYDAFNPGRTYKYISPGPGWHNNNITYIGMRIPKDYPLCRERCRTYYTKDGCPLKWAVWSVGPGGDIDLFEHESRDLPVPKWEWFPYKEDGIIVRLSDGRISP